MAANRANIVALARAEIARRKARQVVKEECENDLLAFVRNFWPVIEPETKLVEGWVLDSMCDALMSVADGYIKRLIINVSPGSMKSLLLNVFFPAWLWGPCKQPHLRFLSASYSVGLPERDNDRFRRLISHPSYRALWGEHVQLVREGLGLVENSKTGWKRAVSVGSGTTGHRADFCLLDDCNDPNTVESDAVRAGTNLWLREVLPDRLNNLDDGVIINIQQRTHDQDATGVLAEHGSGYSWIVIPMEYDPLRDTEVPLRWDDSGEAIQWFRDPRGRDENGIRLEGLHENDRGELRVRMGSPLAKVEGELAWPERFSPEACQAMKKIKGEYAWSNQYQQLSTVRGGGLIRRDWWQLWNEPRFPAVGTTVASLDTAIKESEESDYNALTVWGAFPGPSGEPKLILLAAWRVRTSLATLVARVAETCWEQRVDYLLIEDKARGHDVAAEILRQFDDVSWQTILIPANGRGAFSGDKVARLKAVAPMFSGDVRRDPVTGMDTWIGGMIYEPGRDWSEEVVAEVEAFPRGSHDDYVDTVSMALAWMRRHGVVLRKAEYDREELDRKKFRRAPAVPYAISS